MKMIVITGLSAAGLQKSVQKACELATMDMKKCKTMNALLERFFHSDALLAVVDLDFLAEETGIFLEIVHRLYANRQVIVLAASESQARSQRIETGRGIAHVFTQPPSPETLSAFLVKARGSIEEGTTAGSQAPV